MSGLRNPDRLWWRKKKRQHERHRLERANRRCKQGVCSLLFLRVSDPLARGLLLGGRPGRLPSPGPHSLQLSPSEGAGRGTLLIQKSDASAGIGRGRAPPPPALEHEVSTSATRPGARPVPPGTTIPLPLLPQGGSGCQELPPATWTAPASVHLKSSTAFWARLPAAPRRIFLWKLEAGSA